MARVGLLTFSDGRDFVHADIKTFGRDVERRIAQALEQAGHEVIRASEPIWTNTLATTEARRVADARCDLTIFNYPVWAFPHFTMLAAAATPGPLLLFSNIDPQFPGMVGMLAAGGGLDQIGRPHTRVWGDVADAAVLDRVGETVRAAAAVSALSG
ncbi:MAG: fucose isomerase, partial [Pseudonocardiaceae bacterium]